MSTDLGLPLGLNPSDIRDFVLAAAAPLAMWFAWRRLRNADRQEENTRQGQMNDVFKTGVELLGHDRPAVRQGAICVLGELSLLHPENYIHIRVMNIFVSYLAHPPENRRAGKFVLDGPDVAEIERVFNRRYALHEATEREFGFNLQESLGPTLFSYIYKPNAGRSVLIIDRDKQEELERERFPTATP